MRLFIAIVLDESMTDALTEMQDDLMRVGIQGGYTRPENLHITLAFLGENDEPERVIEVMRDVPLKSFTVRVAGTRRFKDMVFANVEESTELHDYVKRLRKALSENDIDYDMKKFTPHITLVRRAIGNKDFPVQYEIATEESMRVKGISLMKSERGKHGMVYTEIGYVRAF